MNRVPGVETPENKALSPIEAALKDINEQIDSHREEATGATFLAYLTGGSAVVAAWTSAVALTMENEQQAVVGAGLAVFTGTVALGMSISAVKSSIKAGALEGAKATQELAQAQRETDDQNPGGLQ